MGRNRGRKMNRRETIKGDGETKGEKEGRERERA